MAPQLSEFVKAYDVRGLVGSQLTPEVMEAIGAAAVAVTGELKWAVGHDMRDSGPDFAAAFARGATAAGASVLDAGLCSTDMLYFIAGSRDVAGAMFTASHNPAEYNGLKMCLPAARPIGLDTGLADIRDKAQAILDGEPAPVAETPGAVAREDFLAAYADYMRHLVDLSGIRPLKVVVDAGNGMGGYTVPAVLGDQLLAALPLDIDELYFELDGTFPNHEANPLEPANIVDLQARVKETGADLGLAFDGDADRCFVVDADGEPVTPSAITALIATRELAKHPGSAICHNLITSKAVPEIVTEAGGRPLRTRVGHSYIKAVMAEEDAIFGGEHSAHYYFKDFWFADTGMLAAMHVLAAVGEGDRSASDLANEFVRYVASGEINSKVTDPNAKIEEVAAQYAASEGVTTDRLDGLTVAFNDGSWANLRPSNTEPLLRLNVEGPDPASMERLRDDILRIVRN
ncbi:phosphomannomutase/phosphoglucomutase [Glycomyces buryatensis]|uniref:Phosphomannomutase/phosphoglucomutase n=1 Tax=Glycomyces buryatensis TaxID=2570927 RepID=A0A4S8QFK1_9ACTN|nr:phosphomannomutase/phosphoglucomutase [Glycomyces buryatensis]THV43160.1 phosphomannomutase/phosphoglucomutase [Glycomyces buryatensis]